MLSVFWPRPGRGVAAAIKQKAFCFLAAPRPRPGRGQKFADRKISDAFFRVLRPYLRFLTPQNTDPCSKIKS